MGSRWAWVGMVGLCALTSGCHERGEQNTLAEPRVETTGVQAPIVNAMAEGPAQRRAPPTGTQVREPTEDGTPVGANTPVTGTAARETAGTATGTASNRNAATGPAAGAANGAPGTAGNAATGTATASNADAAAPGANTAQPAARSNRVMIGYEAVQARDDEAWHLGAARAAKDAATGGSGNAGASLDQVVIASSSVSGRVTRVAKNAITVRDTEGGVYELRLDRHSRGLRQGRQVSLRGLQEGTPVRANFVLMGGRTFARDVQIRR